MSEQYEQEGLTVVVDYDGDCDMCEVLGWTCLKCTAVEESKEARDASIAWSLREADRVPESKVVEHADLTESDFVDSEIILGRAPKQVRMVEEWDDHCHLVTFKVEFIEPADQWWIRREFLEPVVHMVDRYFEPELELSNHEAVCPSCHYACNSHVACPNCN